MRWQLLDNIKCNELLQQLFGVLVFDMLETRQLGIRTLLLLTSFLLSLLFLAFLFLAGTCQQLHVFQLDHYHVVYFFLEFFFQIRHHFGLSHFDIELLLVILSLISVLPVLHVLFLLLFEFGDDLGGSNFDDLNSAISIASSAFLALALLSLFFLGFFLALLSASSIFFFTVVAVFAC